MKGPLVNDVIKLLVDVIESKDTVTVFAELPGVDKKDIDLKVTDEGHVISVDKEKRRYHKEVQLPIKVKPDTVKASYKNGVLEIVFSKLTDQLESI